LVSELQKKIQEKRENISQTLKNNEELKVAERFKTLIQYKKELHTS
jgi:hypothetical protein